MYAEATFQPTDADEPVRAPQPSDTSPGNHHGVTVSPQSPLPASYVTLPVGSRSPPLGLTLPHSRKQARQIPPFSMRSKPIPPRFLRARRTVGDVGEPYLVRRGGDEVALEKIWGDREIVTAVGGPHLAWLRHDGPDAIAAHQSLDATAAGSAAMSPQLGMDARAATIGGGSLTLRARAPGIIAGRRDTDTPHMIVTGYSARR